MVAQGLTLPGHLGSMPTAMAAVKAAFAGKVDPGDVFILNDPFQGGMHLPDVFIFKPIFRPGADDAPIAWAATVCHHTDVGGRVPGSNASDSTEIYQEGLRIPPLKLYERGTRNETPVRADREATCGCRSRCSAICGRSSPPAISPSRRVIELAAHYGAEKLAHYMTELVDYAERMTRAALRELPDGVYDFLDHIDDDGIDVGKPIPLKVTITKSGDAIAVDWTGTSPQVKGAINNTLSLHQIGELLRDPLDPAAEHPEQRRRVPRDRGHRAARDDRQHGVAGRLRRARPDRLPHGRLHVRRAGQDAARPGVRQPPTAATPAMSIGG